MVLRTSKNKYSAEETKVFDDLETHINEIQESQGQLDRITLTARAVKNYSGTDVDEATVSTYAAKVNSFRMVFSFALY
jgi:SET and MYND domain-containing protein